MKPSCHGPRTHLSGTEDLWGCLSIILALLAVQIVVWSGAVLWFGLALLAVPTGLSLVAAAYLQKWGIDRWLTRAATSDVIQVLESDRAMSFDAWDITITLRRSVVIFASTTAGIGLAILAPLSLTPLIVKAGESMSQLPPKEREFLLQTSGGASNLRVAVVCGVAFLVLLTVLHICSYLLLRFRLLRRLRRLNKYAQGFSELRSRDAAAAALMSSMRLGASMAFTDRTMTAVRDQLPSLLRRPQLLPAMIAAGTRDADQALVELHRCQVMHSDVSSRCDSVSRILTQTGRITLLDQAEAVKRTLESENLAELLGQRAWETVVGLLKGMSDTLESAEMMARRILAGDEGGETQDPADDGRTIDASQALELLGFGVSASVESVMKSHTLDQAHEQYRRVVRKFHPDSREQDPSHTAVMKQVNAAWEMLRRQYKERL